jgi:two-component system OmpR family response regulator
MRILLIEDDKATADYIAKGLQEIGHVVQVARTGRDGMLLAAGEAWDVIVTDRMLPGPDGLTILRTLRASGITTPVLVLTALGEVERRVEGLDAGADDYLAKPFAFSELRARIAALARRPVPTTGYRRPSRARSSMNSAAGSTPSPWASAPCSQMTRC